MADPIKSVAEWMLGAGHGGQHVKLYEALCMEEQGEAMLAFHVADEETVDTEQHRFAHALIEFSKVLRQHDELKVLAISKSLMLDAHLDSVWVHLCAALALVGGDTEKLRAAWSELHRSNVDAKKVDGEFVKDATGKVIKPQGWTPPNFNQFFV